MSGRRLAPEERALWRRVTETVRPLEGRAPAPLPEKEGLGVGPSHPPSAPGLPAPTPSPSLPGRGAKAVSSDTLDGGWDRRLRRGLVVPERTIDLHGHTLASAHAALDHALDRAIADDIRTLLLVTGKPPREGAAPPRRGAIRASIGDWLALSRHAARIAAIRNAHPRHGGTGALYIILRRRRD